MEHEIGNPNRTINSAMTKILGETNKLGKAMKHPNGANSSIIFKRPGRHNWPREAKGHSGKANKHLGGNMKPNKAGVYNAVNYANKL